MNMEPLLLQKRPGVVIDPVNGKYRIVHSESPRQYFRLGVREADFYESLDGLRTAGELRASNPQEFTPEQVDAMLAWFEKQHLIGSEAPPVIVRKVVPWYLLIWGFITQPDQFRLHLYNPDRLLDRCRTAIDALFSRVAIGCYLLLLLAPVLVYLVRPQLATEAARNTRPLSFLLWGALYLLLLLMNVMHELAHAVACKHFGGKVTRIGFMLLYLNPVIYCDVSDSWRFPSVNRKLTVAVAGIFLQFLLTGAGLTLWLFTGSGLVLNFIIFNTFIALFNFFPFIRLDGYWMLVHLLDEPNLHTKGLKVVNNGLRRMFLRSSLDGSKSASPVVMAWGIGHAIAIPFFWLLGLYGLHRRLSHISVTMAWIVVAVFGGVLFYRLLKIAVTFSRSMMQQSSSVAT